MLGFFRKLFGLEPEEKADPMKYLIVGLGNVGQDYIGTRHNIGFEIVDYLAQENGQEFEIDTLGAVATVRHKGRQLILLKPSTYMNLSGKSVRYWMQKKKILPDNLLIVLDDLNLDFGRIRIRKQGSPGGHNGLKSIDQMLGHQNYARMRFGIGSDFSRGRQVDYVLGQWSEDELAQLPDLLDSSAEAIQAFATIGIDRAMSAHNN